MKYSLSIIVIIVLLVTFSLSGVVFAFTGPGSLAPGSGNGAFQVDANFNIGFGTNLATPTGDSTNAVFGRVITIASSSDPGLALRNLSTGGGKYILYARSNGRFVIWDDTAFRPRLFIDSSGSVGIPGNGQFFFTPSSTLQVAGNIQTDAAFVGSMPATSIVGGAFSSSNYAFPSSLAIGTTTYTGLPTSGLYVNGNVGIGTKSPGAKLHVDSASTTVAIFNGAYPSNYLSLRVGEGTGGAGEVGRIEVNNDIANGGSLSFYTKPSGTAISQKMIIKDSGNIGIGVNAALGTISPTAKLEVNGIAAVPTTPNAYADSSGILRIINGGRDILDIGSSPSSPYAYWIQAGVDGVVTRPISLNPLGGNVGVGTTNPTAKLSIGDGINALPTSTTLWIKGASGTGTTNRISLGLNNNQDYGIYIAENNVDYSSGQIAEFGTRYGGTDYPALYLRSGNVGIGTTAPGQKLTVVGTIESTTGGIKFPDGSVQVTAGGNSSSIGWVRSGTYVTLATSTDFVGIGTSTPGAKLDVQGGGIRNDTGYYLKNAGGGYAAVLSITSNKGTNTATFRDGDGNAPLELFGNNVYFSTATGIWQASGSVGIGTITPTSTAKLHVVGNIYASGNIVTGGTMTTNVGASNVSAGTFGFTAGKGNYRFEGAATTNDVLKIDATNERVGVGTGSPATELDILGAANGLPATSSISQPNASIRLGNVITNGILDAGMNSGAAWMQATNKTDLSQVYPILLNPNGGNVGIGTTGPGKILELNTSSGVESALRIRQTGWNYWDFKIPASTTRLTLGDTNGDYFTILNGGNVGIGTTAPGATLTLGGTTATKVNTAGILLGTAQNQIEFVNSDYGLGYGYQINGFDTGAGGITRLDFDYRAGSASWTNMMSLVNGNVGIGTTTPASALHVIGDIRASGNIIAGGTMTANVSAPNVSAGTFGTTAGKGNYTFEAAASTNNVLKIDATNERVGIGTGSPGSKLSVYNDASNNYNIPVQIQPSANTKESALAFLPSGTISASNTQWTIGRSYNANRFSIRTWDGATDAEQLVMNSSGNIGIGTTVPYNRLSVNAASWSAPSLTHQAVAIANFTGGPGVDLVIGTDQNSPYEMWIQARGYATDGTSYPISLNPAGGNIGIGTTAPTAKLDVFGGGATSTGNYKDINIGNAPLATVSDAASYGAAISISRPNLPYNDAEIFNYLASSGALNMGLKARSDFAFISGNSNTDIMRLTAGGNVGIGTTTPASALHVIGDIRASGNIIAGGTMTANVSAPNVSAGTFGTTAGKGNYTFEAAASTNNVLKIDATNERVGIGTGSPGDKLSINFSDSQTIGWNANGVGLGIKNTANLDNVWSTVNFSGSGNLAAGIGTQIISQTNSYGDIVFFNRGFSGWTEKMRINSSGNVGIGTTSPGQLLHVYGANAAMAQVQGNNGLATMRLISGAYTTGYDMLLDTGGTAYLLNRNNGPLTFGTNNTEQVRITSSGNVGIGTTNPSQKLEVAGNIYIPGTENGLMLQRSLDGANRKILWIEANSAPTAPFTGGATVIQSISDADIMLMPNTESTVTGLTIKGTTGNVGIGTTSPQYRVDIPIANKIGTYSDAFHNASIEFYNNTTANMNFQMTNMSGGSFTFSGGNVGIGTTTPGTYKLYVAGGAKFDNPIEIGSPTADNHATTKSYVDSLLGTGGSGTSTASFGTIYVSGTSTLAATGGRVNIGANLPAVPSKVNIDGSLQIIGTMSATAFYDYDNTSYYINPNSSNIGFKTLGSVQSDGAIDNNYFIANTLIGTSTNPGAYKFVVSGTSYFSNQMTVNANLLMGASQNITLQSGNIIGVNKITAAIIDPLYEIDGEKYATYGSDTVGVKTELFAKGTLAKISNSQCSISNQISNTNDSIDTSLKTENCKLQNYVYIIDFNKVERGSDLWVFWQTIKEGTDMKNITLTLTPEGGRAELWYELLPVKKQVVVYGDAPVTFSYHIVAPRHDSDTWTTKRGKTDEKPSFILKSR